MLNLNYFLNKSDFCQDIIDYLNNYNIEDSEYNYCKKLFDVNTDFLIKHFKPDKYNEGFLLKLYVLFACDNFDIFTDSLNLKSTNVTSLYNNKAALEQIYFDTMSDIKIWQEVYRRQTGKIGLTEALWVANSIKGNIFRLGRLQFEPDAVGNIVHIHIPEGKKLDIDDCKRSIILAGKIFSEYKECDCSSWLLSPNILPLLDEDSGIRKFQSLFNIEYINYDFPQASQRVLGEYSYKSTSSLILRLKEYIKKYGDPGIGYGKLDFKTLS